MTKKATLEVIACQYYVECQMSVKKIAERLNTSEKTIFNWKKDGEWDKKREFFLKSQYSTNQTMYELVHLIAQKAVEDFKTEGILPDQKTTYFLMNMFKQLSSFKQFEDKLSEEKIAEAAEADNTSSQEENKANITEDALKNIFKAIIGG